MAIPNTTQKVTTLPIDANLLQTLNNYLQLGYVIHQLVNMNPTSNTLLIVYYDPAVQQ